MSLSQCIYDHYLKVFDVLLYFNSPLCLSLSVFMITILMVFDVLLYFNSPLCLSLSVFIITI